MARKITTTTTTGTIANVRHAGTSYYGNPSYWIDLTDGRSYRTQNNASIGYSASNYRPSHGTSHTVTLTLTPADRVTDITPA